MIDWLLNDVLWGCGWKRAYVLRLVFLRTGVGYCNTSIMLMFGGFRGSLEKWWPGQLLYTTIFRRVLDG